VKIRSIVVIAAALWGAAAPPLGAHAFLEHAKPAVGSTVEAPPPALELHFTEGVEPAFSTIEVVDLDRHATVRAGAVEHPDPSTLSVSLPRLSPGDYEVRWKVVSIDTHETEGTFRFHVAPR
jgi:copper resistance protein C